MTAATVEKGALLAKRVRLVLEAGDRMAEELLKAGAESGCVEHANCTTVYIWKQYAEPLR